MILLFFAWSQILDTHLLWSRSQSGARWKNRATAVTMEASSQGWNGKQSDPSRRHCNAHTIIPRPNRTRRGIPQASGTAAGYSTGLSLRPVMAPDLPSSYWSQECFERRLRESGGYKEAG